MAGPNEGLQPPLFQHVRNNDEGNIVRVHRQIYDWCRNVYREFVKLSTLGIIGLARKTANQGPIGAGTTLITDTSVTVNLTAGRRYSIKVHCSASYFQPTAIGNRWFYQVFMNGASIGEVYDYSAQTTTFVVQVIDSEIIHEPTTSGAATFDLRLVRFAGAGVVDHFAGAASPTTLYVTDIGLV